MIRSTHRFPPKLGKSSAPARKPPVGLVAIVGYSLALSIGIGWTVPLQTAAAQASEATELSAADTTFFETKVRPVLIEHCYDCHSAESGTAEGGLRLDSREATLRGGDSGASVIPGDPAASLLMRAIQHVDPALKMPPKQARLPDQVIADFRSWIERGAPAPRESDEPLAERGWDNANARTHWAYQPVIREPRVRVSTSSAVDPAESRWARNFIDVEIGRGLAAQGLKPSPDASLEVLLRRLHFDLIGLPPTPEDSGRFAERVVAEGLEAAMQVEADRLLDSPQYGERWGRHWLDVARFGESSGKEANISFPYAWRYRDYVIDAFHTDVPFDRFLTEQIAGDQLEAADAAERARLLIATGFLAIGTKNLDEPNMWQFFADLIDEQIDTVTRAVMASSLACARCHDHKSDPFTMADYYALAGVFASTETFFGTSVSPSNRIGGTPLVLPRDAGQPIFHASLPAKRVEELKAELASMQAQEREGREAVRRAIAAGEDPSNLFTLTDALRIFWRTGAIQGELNRASDKGQALPLAMGVQEREQMVDVPLLQRGDIHKPGDVVPRALPSVLHFAPPRAIPADSSGRLELARWLAHPQHPLTSRVLVNRVWSHLFGTGIVRTVDDFGTTGEPPSHPELLDQLAGWFVEEGWSIKRLVREMVLSRTYRQASDYNEQSFQIDPDNRLLWRQSKRRLDAEVIRDAMLAVSGELDLERPAASLVGRVIGDRPVSLLGLDKRLPPDLDGARYRSVYLPVIRDRLPDALDLFDFAEPSLVTGQRAITNVPIQALYLMNSPFVQDRAAALAERVTRVSDVPEKRTELVFRWCFNRVPDEIERARSLAFLRSLSSGDESGPGTEAGSVQAASPSAWTVYCQAILSAAEFRNLD